MTNQDNWKQLNIYLTESDCWRNQPLYMALVEAAHKQRLRGVTVMRAITGFGERRMIHTTQIFELSADLPVVVTIIEQEETITQFLSIVREMVESRLVTIQSIELLNPIAVDNLF